MRSIDELRPIKHSDMVGFYFGDYHTSQFGLVRVSSGNRYTEYLFPTLKTNTVDNNSIDGSLYFGTNKSTRTFQIDLAFDSVTEDDLRDIKEWLTGVHPLIFDERPYVAYTCTLNSAPQIKFLTFNENGNRVYKGEMSITFISYLPYGYTINGKKYIDDFLDENFDEWSSASKLVWKDGLDEFREGQINLYNGGDVETDYTLTFYTTAAGKAKITLGSNSYEFTLPSPTKTHLEVKINSKLQLAQYNNVKIENNRVIESDNTNTILITDSLISCIPIGKSILTYEIDSLDTNAPNSIEYRYRFL